MNDGLETIFQPGEVFHGYVVKKLLGAGAGGAVYLVHHEILDSLFALKVLIYGSQSDEEAADEAYIKRFLREARLASRIRHPNLVSVHDCGYDDYKGLYYLVMDYVPGVSLRDMIALEGRIPAERAADIVSQVASALEAAQAFKVVHRDIKPENILVQPDGRVKLVDLGIAKAQNVGDTLETSADSVFGTPSYISPEQAQCSANVDARADIYSLGIVFFEMLTGKCPYSDSNPAVVITQILSEEQVPDVRDVVPGVSPGLAVLIRRMTVKDRMRRIDTFSAVLDELCKLGFGNVKRQALPTEYVAPPSPSVGMKTLLEGLDGASKSSVDPLAMPDDDVRSFLDKKTMIRRRQAIVRWTLIALGAIGAFLVALIVFQ